MINTNLDNLNQDKEGLQPMITPTSTPSNESNDKTYPFHVYANDLHIPEVEGLRTVKVLYNKNPKTGLIAGTNSFVRVPDFITKEWIQDNLSSLAPSLITYLQEKEKEIIKEHHKASVVLNQFRVGSDAFLTELGKEKVKARRLNKAEILKWFEEVVSEDLAVALWNKQGGEQLIGEEDIAKLEFKIVKLCNVYKDKFASLAAPSPSLSENDCTGLLKVLDLTEDGARVDQIHTLSVNIRSKLEGVLESLSEVVDIADML